MITIWRTGNKNLTLNLVLITLFAASKSTNRVFDAIGGLFVHLGWFGAIARKYGVIAPNYGAIAPKYGVIALNYGVIALKYRAIAPKYRAITPKYGIIALNHGFIAPYAININRS